jgi:DNA polymerase bacteriophage-type
MLDRLAVIDFETRSAVDLRKTGVERYAEEPTTSVLCLAWCFDEDQVDFADRRTCESAPLMTAALDELFEHVASGGHVVAHNARFEINIWRMMTRRHGWPELKAEQTFDTMAMARALSLPGSLGELARALRLHVEKDDAGHRLMLKMCKPRKPRKGEREDILLWHEDPADLERLIAYCARDVETEREAFKSLARLSPKEQALWTIDQRINDRGIYVDAEGVELCFAATEAEKKRLAAEMKALTGGFVSSANNTAKLLLWLGDHGPQMADLRKGTVGDALTKGEHDDAGRRALEIRQEAAKASTAKLKAMINSRCADGRARGLLEYHGASTGRWAGRRIQTQNMPRCPEDFEPRDCENIISWLRVPGGAEGVRMEYPSVMDGVSWSLRSLIAAAPGNRLLCADYSNIEGRGLAWLAGEEWKLQAFRDLDGGTGHDLYKLAYSKSFGVPVEDVSKPQRQIGKVQELALGYQGGHGAFLSMGANYGIDLDAIARAVRDAVGPNRWQSAIDRYWSGAVEQAEEILADRRAEAAVEDADESDENELFEIASEIAKKNRYELGADAWAAIRIIVDGWRDAHPYTVGAWRALNDAALEAVENPGRITSAARCHYRMSEHYLLCRLPSGRVIAYPYARVSREQSKFTDRNGNPLFDKKLVFEGTDSRTKKWMTQRAYGGLLAENITQAAARDVLSDAIMRLEAREYPVVMHVHDEIVSEVPLKSAHTLVEFEAIMAKVPEWAPGFPIAVAGWEGERYRK